MSPEDLSNVPNAIALICDLHKADGVEPIGRMRGAWFRRIDNHWSIWVNGQMTAQAGGPGGDVSIPPGECYVEFNGWPAGIFSMLTGEGELAAGELANYGSFCAALQSAVESRKS
jgi:hypothetical protein